MIQRIQTVYLLLALLAGAFLFFLPIFTLTPGDTTLDSAVYTFKLLTVSSLKGGVESRLFRPTALIFMVTGIEVFLILAVFSFSNRKRQMMICKSVIFLLLALVGLFLYQTSQLRTAVGPGHSLHFGVAITLPICMMIGVVLANKAIRKDDELVRSADRLR